MPDMSDASAWRAAVDVDFRFESSISGLTPPSTPPLMRTLADGIDISEAASGILYVSLNSNTEGVARAKIGRATRLNSSHIATSRMPSSA